MLSLDVTTLSANALIAAVVCPPDVDLPLKLISPNSSPFDTAGGLTSVPRARDRFISGPLPDVGEYDVAIMYGGVVSLLILKAKVSWFVAQ